MKTRAIVSELRYNAADTNVILSDIHRTIVKGQEENGGKNRPVSVTRVPSMKLNADHCMDSDQVSDRNRE